MYAIDPSESMLELAGTGTGVDAARRDPCRIRPEALPLPDTRVDVAVATQVFEYVADLPGAVGARTLRTTP